MTESPAGPVRVGFQGEYGAYSESAALELYGDGIATHPFVSFEEVYLAVETGSVEIALIPIENSLAGSIHRNYDLMLRHRLNIQREIHLRISHCLLGLPGVNLADIRRAHSHPQALAQCEVNLVRLGLEPVVELDTAGSARLIRELGEPQEAAIASRRAAEVYGLDVLVENMEDFPENYTRFLALSAEPSPSYTSEGDEYKTSIVFSLPNVPGSLYRALSVFALRDIDLTKIESRPLPSRPLEYLFYVDFAGHSEEANCHRALDHLGESAPFLRLLGSYPRHRLP